MAREDAKRQGDSGAADAGAMDLHVDDVVIEPGAVDAEALE